MNNQYSTSEIRNKFIQYFLDNNHTLVRASSLIPHNDPSLMFVNSGMVQFKNVFTGQEQRDYKKAVSSQKSLRAGGKHNDLDNVGYTARHHTFFEMLGNFSFGDYFKEEAIYYAWHFLTKELGLDKNKLYATIYHTDEDAAGYWKKIANLEDSRIIRIKTNDNFWSMGDTGPCGPCSEIFYDHGEGIFGGLPGTKDEDGDRFIEIWNMVFMEFEQIDKETRIPLPQKSIDTGMGLERITAVLQGKHNNYEIDLFQDLISHAESLLKNKIETKNIASYRVIADHLRACSFLIADGVIPSNEGRGYVLRRIMRRSIRHAHHLGSRQPIMHKLLPKLVELMGVAYPELKRAEDFISNILEQEEIRFIKTLERGLKMLDDESLPLQAGDTLSGKVAFKLYDTYGFPLDLTEDILRSKNIVVNKDEFNADMLEQKQRARSAWNGSGESKTDKIWFDIQTQFGDTEFLGYTFSQAEGIVECLIQDGNHVKVVSQHGAQFTLITNQTPFYGESGGQMGDVGKISTSACEITVINTVKYLGGIIAHVCILESGVIKVEDHVNLRINECHRNDLRVHHSATHILHAALRQVLGTHVTQKGSLVAKDRLRFDISHQKALSKEEICAIEKLVNKVIRQNLEVGTKILTLDDAVNSGAMALFGEKYDSEVRVVSMDDYSIELCGGTHVARTGDIGGFIITNESAIAAGIRRIEAVCGEYAIDIMQQNRKLISDVASELKVNSSEIYEKIKLLIANKKDLENELQNLQIASLALTKEQIILQAKPYQSAIVLYKQFENVDAKLLRIAVEQNISKVDNLLCVYLSVNQDKVSIIVANNKLISDKVNACSIANEISLLLDGKGCSAQGNLVQTGGVKNAKLKDIANKFGF